MSLPPWPAQVGIYDQITCELTSHRTFLSTYTWKIPMEKWVTLLGGLELYPLQLRQERERYGGGLLGGWWVHPPNEYWVLSPHGDLSQYFCTDKTFWWFNHPCLPVQSGEHPHKQISFIKVKSLYKSVTGMFPEPLLCLLFLWINNWKESLC